MPSTPCVPPTHPPDPSHHVHQTAFEGGVKTWYSGLNGLIGPPHPNLLEAMTDEHTTAADSERYFLTDNYGVETTSEIEWTFVSNPDEGLSHMERKYLITDFPTEQLLRADPSQSNRCRVPKPPGTYDGERRKLKRQLEAQGCAPLLDAEFLAGRLYTGPMCAPRVISLGVFIWSYEIPPSPLPVSSQYIESRHHRPPVSTLTYSHLRPL